MMKWTNDTPTQGGTYWYRRANDKPRHRVTVKDNKAFFDSGDVKDLPDVKGHWRGPISSIQSLSGGKEDEGKPGVIRWALRAIGTICSTIVGGLLLVLLQGRLSLTEPKLEFASEKPTPIMKVETKVENGRGVVYLRKSVPFKNYGLFKDHIDRVEITKDGLNEPPRDVKILRVEKIDLAWLEEKEIEFEALFNVVAVPEDKKDLSFRVTYWAAAGFKDTELGV